MHTICANCQGKIPTNSGICPQCGTRVVIAHTKGVAVGGDVVDSVIITGDIEGDLYIERQVEIHAPPEPRQPPDITGFIGRLPAITYYSERLGQSHFALITGMAGVGKTWLATVLARRFREPERIFWHSFRDGESADTVIWKLAGFLYHGGQEELWRTLDIARQTGGQLPPLEVLLDSLLQMLRYQGCLLVFDDFQFVDQDPVLVQFCQQLRSLAQEASFALLMTSRRMPKFVLSSEFDPLPGFSITDAQELFDKRSITLPGPVIAELHNYTGGNAGLLNLAVAVIARSPDADPARVVARLIQSDDIDDFLCQVHDSLSPAEQGVMETIALLMGYPGTRQAIEYIWEQRARQPMRELVRLHLVLTSQGGTDKEFQQHAILQAFFYDLLSQIERKQLHLRAAQFYKDREIDQFKAAMHYQRAGEDEQAARLVTQDMDALLNRGYAQPLRKLLTQFNSEGLTGPLWARTRIALGLILGRTGDVQAAKGNFQEAFAVLEDLPDSQEQRKDQALACRRIGELLEHENPQKALVWLQLGLEMIADDNLEQSAAIHLIISGVQTGLGHYDAALEAVEKAMSLLPRAPNWMHIDVLIALGNICSYRGDIIQGMKYSQQALKLSKEMADHYRMISILSNLSLDMFFEGDWQGGIAQAQEALTFVEQWGGLQHRVRLIQNTGWMYTLMGDDEQAEGLLNTSLELSQKHLLREFELSSAANLADLYIRQGKIDAAETYISVAEKLAITMDMKSELPEVYRSQALIYLAKEQMEEAVKAIDYSLSQSREMKNSFQEGMSLRVFGQLQHANGQTELALQSFENSLKLLVDDPYETARTQTQFGRALLNGTDDNQGLGVLQDAQEAFQHLGAKRDLAFVAKILNDVYLDH